jgi:transposase
MGRALQTFEGGESRQEAAERFEVSLSLAVKWLQLAGNWQCCGKAEWRQPLSVVEACRLAAEAD